MEASLSAPSSAPVEQRLVCVLCGLSAGGLPWTALARDGQLLEVCNYCYLIESIKHCLATRESIDPTILETSRVSMVETYRLLRSAVEPLVDLTTVEHEAPRPRPSSAPPRPSSRPGPYGALQ